MNDTDTLYYPNQMGRIILLSMEEVLGQKGLASLLRQAGLENYIDNYPPDTMEKGFTFDNLSQLHDTLEQVYGPRGGRGLALRVGRATFKHGLRIFGPKLGFTDMEFRLSPMENKLRSGAEIFADIFNRFTDQRVRVETYPDHLLWHIERCPICWNRQSDTPVCHLAVGLLQESLYWVSGGKIFKIDEIGCIACGDPTCCIRIDKQALD